MPFGLHFFCRLGIVNDGDKPVTVPSDVKDYVAIHVIGILEDAANFVKIVPADSLDDTHPRFDFVRRIRISFHRLAEVPSRNDEHLPRILHNM
jgi:hypothetical protein